ncbi:MAG: GTP-binding protein [Blastopirellula sp.]|nr:GTP-binding protein [Blastopirellula sp.]
MSEPANQDDQQYQQAAASLEKTLGKLRGCSDAERSRMQHDLAQLQGMKAKLASGRVEIVVFGEISTGKSALINALTGEVITEVDVQGGWTKEVWNVPWEGSGYRVHGLADSEVVLVDTPGINEVGGTEHAEVAREAAQRADLILFVTDSDLNATEHTALTALAATLKPVILVLNKADLYSPTQRERLREVLQERTDGMVAADQIVETSADPREREYIVERADGSEQSEWRKPPVAVEALKALILQVLEREGLALLALNAAMYASDKSDRIASIRVKYRDEQANKVIWSYAAVKSVVVGANWVPGLDTLGGLTVDGSMVVTLAHIYGLEMSWVNARQLVTAIIKSAGLVLAGEAAWHIAFSTFKLATLGWGTALTAVPQGAIAGYSSYIVGQAAKYYFEHGSSWGGESPKVVVKRILESTDKESVLDRLKAEIQRTLRLNTHAAGGSNGANAQQENGEVSSGK